MAVTITLANTRVVLKACSHTRELVARIEGDRIEYGLVCPRTANALSTVERWSG